MNTLVMDINREVLEVMVSEVKEVTGTVEDMEEGLHRDHLEDCQDQQMEGITIREYPVDWRMVVIILEVVQVQVVDWERMEVDPQETVDIPMELPVEDQVVVLSEVALEVEVEEHIRQVYPSSHQDLVVQEVHRVQAVELSAENNTISKEVPMPYRACKQ